ncbi:MAG TPA: hypothetical protein VH143_08035 [Kofleriaceae bacterium]|jgi:hypothetical protein|nr:hypothetical protein [Kofleriaceae bacterium]
MTSTIGKEMSIVLQSGMSAQETSISMYHEVLEAASVRTLNPSFAEYGEAEYEAAAVAAHAQYGYATIDNSNIMLKNSGF